MGAVVQPDRSPPTGGRCAHGSQHADHGRRTEEVTTSELAPDEAFAFFRDVMAPLTRRYGWLAMWIVRNVDKIDINKPKEAAQGRPVFELLPALDREA